MWHSYYIRIKEQTKKSILKNYEVDFCVFQEDSHIFYQILLI